MAKKENIDTQAEELNKVIKKASPHVFNLLSRRGREIYFPKAGILTQSAEAKSSKINATIGIAVDDNGKPLCLNSIAENVNLLPQDVFNYSPSYGRAGLRQKWKEMLYAKNSLLKGKKISTPVVCNALTHGLSIAAYLFADENDSIIVPDLFWENYTLIFGNTYGARLEAFEFFKKNKFNLDGLRKKLNENGKKKILLLNFPNNPAGYTPTEKEAYAIADIIRKAAENSEIVVIIDDAYLGLVYKEGIFKESIFELFADMHEKILAVKIDGISKEDYAWGLRVGFITFAAKNCSESVYSSLESKAAGAVRATISNAPNISQSLALKAYNSKSYAAEKKKNFQLLKSRFEEVEKVLANNLEYKKHFAALPFNSGYFMCIKVKGDTDKIRRLLIEKYSTGVISSNSIMRIAFSSVKKDIIPKLFENIYNACQEKNHR